MSQVNFTDADLSGSNLSGADLSLSRMIRADLSDAKVDNSLVADFHIQDLNGTPQPPTSVRIDSLGTTVSGSKAETFFCVQVTVEIYLTEKLTERDIVFLQLHFAEVHDRGIAKKIYFVGHRDEEVGTIIRFQGESFEETVSMLAGSFGSIFERSRCGLEKVIRNSKRAATNRSTRYFGNARIYDCKRKMAVG